MADRQLDKNYLVIRKRTYGELIDLTFRLIQKEGLRVYFWLACLAVPFVFLNHYLARLVVEGLFGHGYGTEEWSIAYGFMLFFLTLAEIPFVSSLPIIYLGKRIFAPETQPEGLEVFGSWLESFGQLFFFLLLLFPMTLFFYECTVEIIVLEKTPFVGKKNDRISTFKRMKIFHQGRFGEQIAFGLFTALFAALILPGMYLCISYGIDLFFGNLLGETPVFTVVVFPLFLWICSGPVIILHFLRYLDMRIEREGWDVELAFRAERARMKDQ